MRDYVLDSRNVHQVLAPVEAYGRDKRYGLVPDASIFCSFDRYLSAPIESLKRGPIQNLRVFYGELLRLLEVHDSFGVLPEVKAEFANLIAASTAQIDRKKLQYQQLTPFKKDQVVETFNHLLKIEELLRKILRKLEERALSGPRTNEKIASLLLDLITYLATALELKKPDGARSDTDERIAARAFHDVLVHHQKVAVCTRDEDVRRVISAVYKLFVSTTVRDEASKQLVRALRYGNIVVLKYNPDREVYQGFFESSTQQEIGEFIFSKWAPEKTRKQVVQATRQALAAVWREIEAQAAAAPLDGTGRLVALPQKDVLDSLAALLERVLWYQEIARTVGVGDIHEEIRVHDHLRTLAAAIRHDTLLAAIDSSLQGLMKKRLQSTLREVQEKSETLAKEFEELAQQQRFRRDIASAERVRAVSADLVAVTRERQFLERALAAESYSVSREDFRRVEELLDRFAANGFNLREGPCLVPPNEIADLTGLDYNSVLRVLSQKNLAQNGGHALLDDAALLNFLR